MTDIRLQRSTRLPCRRTVLVLADANRGAEIAFQRIYRCIFLQEIERWRRHRAPALDINIRTCLDAWTRVTARDKQLALGQLKEDRKPRNVLSDYTLGHVAITAPHAVVDNVDQSRLTSLRCTGDN